MEMGKPGRVGITFEGELEVPGRTASCARHLVEEGMGKRS